MAKKTILCPYCFEEFQTSEALYQCENEDKDIDGEYRCRRTSRKGFDNYWRGEDLPIRYVWEQQQPGFISKLFGSKLGRSACPQCGRDSYRFVCPHCYNWLMREMVENGSEIISVIGSPSSGKTNYIVALIQQLRKYGYKLDLQVTATQEYRDGHKEESTQSKYNSLERQLFKEKTVLGKTPETQRDTPLIFYLHQQSTNKRIYLVFYDTAGEKFQEHLSTNVKYLQKSSGVIVLLDILSVGKIKEILKKNGLKENAGAPSAEFREIQEALSNFDDDTKLRKPFAFVFSKFDAVLDHVDDVEFDASEFISGGKKINSSFTKSDTLDLAKINALSQVIESTLEDEWEEGDFAHFCQQWASDKNKKLPRGQKDAGDPQNNYKFFGVSSFGSMPDENSTLESVEPYRVMDPLMWILHKLGQFNIPTK